MREEGDRADGAIRLALRKDCSRDIIRGISFQDSLQPRREVCEDRSGDKGGLQFLESFFALRSLLELWLDAVRAGSPGQCCEWRCNARELGNESSIEVGKAKE